MIGNMKQPSKYHPIHPEAVPHRQMRCLDGWRAVINQERSTWTKFHVNYWEGWFNQLLGAIQVPVSLPFNNGM